MPSEDRVRQGATMTLEITINGQALGEHEAIGEEARAAVALAGVEHLPSRVVLPIDGQRLLDFEHAAAGDPGHPARRIVDARQLLGAHHQLRITVAHCSSFGISL